MTHDTAEYHRITDAIASTRSKLAAVDAMDSDELRFALKEHLQRAEAWSGTIAEVAKLHDDDVRQQVIDFRRNALADLEIKLAQVISRLGGQPPQPNQETKTQ